MVYDILVFMAFLAGWFLLMRFVLPALGIPTCMSGACQLREKKHKENETHVE